MPAPLFNGDRQRLLDQAIVLSRRSKAGGAAQQLRQEQQLQQLWQRLQPFQLALAKSSQLVTQSPAPIPVKVRRAMAEALMLLTPYCELIDPEAFYGSLPSPTLERYRPMQVPDLWQQDLTVDRLAERFDLDPAGREAIAQRQERALARITNHRQLFQALRQQFDGLNTRADAARLFQQLFGSIPIPEQALEHLGTEFQLIFALNYERNEQDGLHLRGGGWAELETEQQQTIRLFLAKIEQFSFQQFSRFPSFGHTDPQGIDVGLLEQLQKSTGISETEIRRILRQSIGIVPTDQAESFLIHDIYGHFWQLLLTSFEGDYARLASADQCLSSGATAYTSEGPLSLRQLFVRASSSTSSPVSLNLPLARKFFHGEAQQRIGHLLTHLIAELLADMQEFRWSWQHPAQSALLPSSSRFKQLPTKLDLTLQDVEFFFPKVLEPLLSLAVSPGQESSLEQSLLAEWNTYDPESISSLKGAIAQLQALFWQEYLATYAPEAAARGGWFSDFLGNLLQLQHSLNGLYTSTFARQTPLFQAIVVLFVGAYCSEDCYQDFWHLDNDLAQWLIPAWQYWLAAVQPES